MVAGFQVPLIPLFDTAGSDGAVELMHRGPIAVNTAVICVAMVTESVAAAAH